MKPSRLSAGFLCFALFALACHSDSTAPGGTTLPPGLTLRADPFVSTGLAAPVFLTQPLNDGRIFIVEQGGRIRVVTNGVLQTTPFLDITSRVLSGGERGLFSVAFDPQYATNHFFYVYFTSQPSGDIRIERFTATGAETADPASSTPILTQAHSEFPNHNGGLLTFGRDGMLYAGLGDGGGGGDPHGYAQDYSTVLESLLRLDVNRPPTYIPTDNPFVGQANKRGEIWAKGLRNPWRYAFDPPTGLLYIADVGQNAREEIDVVLANTAGLNFGWNRMEGSICYNASACDRTGLTLPVLDYVNPTVGIAVTGGYAYRGTAIQGLQGHYLYSDYGSGFLRSFRFENGAAVDQKDWGLSLGNVASFGVDFAGELYVMSGNRVLKVSPGT
ncbi:MAG: sorbosone dehydrogenase family protein [Gemmatimonadaceae bacterium]